MKFGIEKPTAEQLRRYVRLWNMSGNFNLESQARDEFFDLLAGSEKEGYGLSLADVFGRPENSKIFSLGALVRIFSLPPSYSLDGSAPVVQELSSYYGYVAVISGPGIYGADLYFIDQGPINLAQAIERFKHLSSLT